MSNVVVYVILLDNLTGFSNVLNETVIRNTPDIYSNLTPIIRTCNYKKANEILSAAARERDVEILHTFKRYEQDPLTFDKYIFSEISKENIYNALSGTYLTEPLYKKEFFMKPKEFYNKVQHLERISSVEKKDNLINITEADKNVKKELEYPKNATFLVAIFETLSNITAQTCAGTLIAPQWVLTAANCFNILSNVYGNNTNMTAYKSSYTVVAGAIDPLSDGSTHNVTSVLKHQENDSNLSINYKSVHIEIGPYLALMKIEPEFDGAGLLMVEEKVKKGDVMIYGWTLVENESGADTLRLVRMSALILSSAECQAMYSYNDNDVICFFSTEIKNNTTELSSGGPVLMLQRGEVRMLAVVESGDHVLIAYPLYMHYNWINKILKMK